MVYRPPKHKPAGGGFGSSQPAPNRPSTDPLGDPAGHPDDPEAGLPGDDRNLVAMDDSYAGGDLEDKMWLFWRRQGKNLVRVVVIAGVALLLYEGWNLYQAHAITSLQAENQAAVEQGAPGLLAFAQAHPNTDLGKLALLEAADAFYQGGKFQDAAQTYEKAVSIWGVDEKGQRARIGWAMSLMQGGDQKTAEEHFIAVAQDSTVMPNFRAEGAFYAALSFAKTGDKDNATKWIDEVKGSYKDVPPWNMQAAALGEMIPLLAQSKLIPMSAAPAGTSSATSALATLGQSHPSAATTQAIKPAATSATITAAKPAATTSAAKPPATSTAPTTSTGDNQLQPLKLPDFKN